MAKAKAAPKVAKGAATAATVDEALVQDAGTQPAAVDTCGPYFTQLVGTHVDQLTGTVYGPGQVVPGNGLDLVAMFGTSKFAPAANGPSSPPAAPVANLAPAAVPVPPVAPAAAPVAPAAPPVPSAPPTVATTAWGVDVTASVPEAGAAALVVQERAGVGYNVFEPEDLAGAVNTGGPLATRAELDAFLAKYTSE